MAQVDQLGSVRVIPTSGHGPDGLKDPLNSVIEFDGQSYNVGPGDQVVLPIAGMANVSASGNIRIDDKGSGRKYPNSAPAGA
jgi:hypothetical protein